MPDETARARNRDPQRAPAPPVTTRRVHSSAPDPGAVSGRLPPFRPRSRGVSHADTMGPDDAQLEPIANVSPDLAPSAASGEVVAGAGGAVLEPRDVHEAGIALEGEPADPGEAGDVPGVELFPTDEAEATEERWDPLGEALQQAVTRADPPFAEDLVRSSDPADHVAAEEPYETALASSPSSASSPSPEWGESDRTGVEAATRLDGPDQPNPPGDRFTDSLAATLESLASGLRARGFNALDDAFARGDRLESSLAIFLAGYRAGRGE